MNYTKEKKEKRFTIKDLITIGVFTAIILISGSILGGFISRLLQQYCQELHTYY